MRLTDRLSLPQRIVLVVALAAAVLLVGFYVASLGAGTAAFGWYAYAPLRSTPNYPHTGLAGWLRLVIWLALTAFWALASAWLLRPARPAT
jgi:heme/copper-type cytochrome/quinol oxidase subunit 1